MHERRGAGVYRSGHTFVLKDTPSGAQHHRLQSVWVECRRHDPMRVRGRELG